MKLHTRRHPRTLTEAFGPYADTQYHDYRPRRSLLPLLGIAALITLAFIVGALT